MLSLRGGGAPLVTALVGEVAGVCVEAGETKHVAVVVRAAVALTGRVVAWPGMSPVAGLEVMTTGALAHRAAPTADDGTFRIEGLSAGTTQLRSTTADGRRAEIWTREIPLGTAVFDVGDLGVAIGKGGGLPSVFSADGKHSIVVKSYGAAAGAMGLQVGDEILSIGGHSVATLGTRSLAAVLDEATPDVAVVVKRGDADPITLHRRRGALPRARP